MNGKPVTEMQLIDKATIEGKQSQDNLIYYELAKACDLLLDAPYNRSESPQNSNN